MASVLALLGGAAVNALAFSGSNYLFGKLRDNKGEAERHNKQMEQYTREQEKYNRKRAENIDWLNKRLRDEKSTQDTFSDVNFALQQYHDLMQQYDDVPYDLQQEMKNSGVPYPDITPPALPQFKKTEELIFVGVGTAAVCAMVFWMF